MTSIAIAYSSGHGHTRTVAEHIKQGADTFPGARAELIEITASQLQPDGRWQDDNIMARLAKADAIVFGAPTYMGSAHGLFKLFLETGYTPGLIKCGRTRLLPALPTLRRAQATSLSRSNRWPFLRPR